jgi:hypothetical protein
LLPQTKRFWEIHRDEGCGQVAKTLTPTVKGKTIELGFDAEVREALEIFRNALEAKKAADKAKTEAEAILRAKLGDAEFATIGGSNAFKMAQVIMERVDNAKLLEQFPAVHAEVLVDGSYEFIKTVN